MKSGPIILIEDDDDDKEVMQEVLADLQVKNDLIWFNNFEEAFQYLKTTSEKPFIILCDINISGNKGTQFKYEIDADPQLRKKSIPFIFYSTSVDQETVNEAYIGMTVQGFFMKGNSYKEVKEVVKVIMEYWKYCSHPNKF